MRPPLDRYSEIVSVLRCLFLASWAIVKCLFDNDSLRMAACLLFSFHFILFSLLWSNDLSKITAPPFDRVTPGGGR